MQFKYTRHAQQRIRQRELIAEQIEETVARPDRTKPSCGGRHLAYKRFRDKILAVVYRREENRVVLIMAYWLEEG